MGKWKKRAMEGLAWMFPGEEATQEGAKSAEAEVEKPHVEIGQLVVERDLLAEVSDR